MEEEVVVQGVMGVIRLAIPVLVVRVMVSVTGDAVLEIGIVIMVAIVVLVIGVAVL